MSISTSLFTLPALYLLTAILAPITFKIFRTFKNKVIVLIICALNLALSLKFSFNAYFANITPTLERSPWPYIGTELNAPFLWIALSTCFSLSGFIGILFIPRDIFQSTISPFLILLAFLQIISLSNDYSFMIVLCIIAGLIINIPFYLNFKKDEQLFSLMSLLMWLRISDILLLFSAASYYLQISISFSSALLLTGIFIRFSFLIAVSSLRELFPLNISTTNLFYCLCFGLLSVVLLVKAQLVITIPKTQVFTFIALYSLSGISAFISLLLKKNNSNRNLDLSFFLLPILFILTLLELNIYMLICFFAVGIALAFIHSHKVNATFQEENLPQHKISFICSKLHFDILIENFYLKTITNLAYITRKIISPVIDIFWLHIPAFITANAIFLSKIVSAGGAQKTISVIFLGLILFLIYYVEISL
ncbi:MAG: hypothetical protein O2897_05985 [bacterium]|nr:hypothetical protein [bacterium]